jgi:molecular chaperone GrpE
MSDEKQLPPDNSSHVPSEAEAVDQALDQGAETLPFESAGGASMSAEQLVEKLRNDVALADERALRAQAEFENFRKRTRRDYEDQLRYANVPVLRDALEVLDNLRRAIASAANNEQASALRDGVELVARQLESVLVKYQCRPIPAVGEAFDPNYHEAISQMPSNDQPAGFVLHEVLPGFQLGERVIRPSQVIVSTGPAQS